MKKVAMIIASDNFRDEEFLEPKRIFEDSAIKVIVASSRLSVSTGVLGAKVKPDILIDDLNTSDYNAIIFVGGGGSSEYWDNSVAQRIAKEANDTGKIIAAICIAPVTLANAGILQGKKATVFPSESGKIKSKGAIYSGEDVEQDGNIITASGPQSAKDFAYKILESLR